MSGLRFCTPAQVFQFIPTRTIDDPISPESATTAIDKDISKTAKRILQARTGITFPTEEPDPLTNTWLLLKNLNLLPAVPPQLSIVGLSCNPQVFKFASAFKKLGEDRIKEWETHRLLNGYFKELEGNPLPITALTTVTECCRLTPGFTPINADDDDSDNKLNQPYIETIEEWILMETAIVRVKAARRGGKQVNADFTDDQEELYSELVAGVVQCFVLGVRAIVEGKYDQVDSYLASLLAEARENQELITVGRHDDILVFQ